ncbi:MAG: hypothetical protein U5L11_05630 [Arhodomonas sp.]|nr:hypothetical protein [Arhodomonas sp.]
MRRDTAARHLPSDLLPPGAGGQRAHDPLRRLRARRVQRRRDHAAAGQRQGYTRIDRRTQPSGFGT